MAREESLISISLPVHADYSSSQYRFVSVNSSGRAQLTGAGAQADGVLQDDPSAQDRTGKIGISGVTKITCGGTVTNGGLVASDSTGRAVDAATGDNICGVALEAGTSGVAISILLKTQNANAIA